LTARGLDAAAADRFRLGYVEPSDDDPRRYWQRMAIPYLTPTGIVQIRYRCLLDHHAKGQDAGGCPKFLGDAGQEVTLYNAHATLDGGQVLFLAEGEPDVWAITTLAGYPAVGIPGSKAWEKHPYWARCFVNFPRLILPADGDDAGTHLATAVAKSLPEVQVVQLPEGEDANSLLARDRAEFLRRCGL
jgi:DNA primase